MDSLTLLLRAPSCWSLSTPCNGFDIQIYAHTPSGVVDIFQLHVMDSRIRLWKIPDLTVVFQLHVMDSPLCHPPDSRQIPLLSTPCNGFVRFVEQEIREGYHHFQLHVMDSLKPVKPL